MLYSHFNLNYKETAMKDPKVKSIMMQNLVFLDPEDTLEDAAVEMMIANCGVLPVGETDNIRGIIIDRDIVIRSISKGKDPAKEKVRDYMTTKIHFCRERDTLQQAAEIMKKNKASRLVVKDDNGDVSGILSLACLLQESVSASFDPGSADGSDRKAA